MGRNDEPANIPGGEDLLKSLGVVTHGHTASTGAADTMSVLTEKLFMQKRVPVTLAQRFAIEREDVKGPPANGNWDPYCHGSQLIEGRSVFPFHPNGEGGSGVFMNESWQPKNQGGGPRDPIPLAPIPDEKRLASPVYLLGGQGVSQMPLGVAPRSMVSKTMTPAQIAALKGNAKAQAAAVTAAMESRGKTPGPEQKMPKVRVPSTPQSGVPTLPEPPAGGSLTEALRNKLKGVQEGTFPWASKLLTSEEKGELEKRITSTLESFKKDAAAKGQKYTDDQLATLKSKLRESVFISAAKKKWEAIKAKLGGSK